MIELKAANGNKVLVNTKRVNYFEDCGGHGTAIVFDNNCLLPIVERYEEVRRKLVRESENE